MTTGQQIFWRILTADILLAGFWLILGGSLLEAIIIAVLQAGILMIIEGAAGTVHQLMEDARERRTAKWKGRRSR